MKYEHKKHFSLEEARLKLVEVKEKVVRIAALKQKLDKLGYDAHRQKYAFGLTSNGTGPSPPEFGELTNLIRELGEQGIIIKGLDEGIIDFPHIRADGEEVYLCWKLGENTINYWHNFTAGFAGRRPISEL